jgi:sedoheptulokinase
MDPMGKARAGQLVSLAIGDNQASFVGSVRSNESCLLINIGTGSQLSMFTEECLEMPSLETRPFCGGGFLLVGSSLCGGRAYAALEHFFRDIVAMATGRDTGELYGSMERLVAAEGISDKLEFQTKYCGTRGDPHQRGEIRNLGLDNFTPEHFRAGTLSGIITELFDYYEPMSIYTKKQPKMLVGSGNGIRLNKPMATIASEIFGLPVRIPLYEEEAAYGAALLAMVSSGQFGSVPDVQKLVRYSDEE